MSLFIKNTRWSKIFSLTLVFSLFKLLVFFAPLILSTLMKSEAEFGKFEYSFNLSQTLTGIFSMGLTSAYAYFIVKKERIDLRPIFHLHFIILTIVLGLIVAIFPYLLDNIYFGAIIISVAFADQLLISGILKLSGKNKTSVIIDTGVYLILSIHIFLIIFKIIDFSFRLWYLSILTCLAFTSLFYHLEKINYHETIKSKQLIELYRYAGLILISGPLVVLLTMNTRLYIEWLIDFESVGKYSMYFRLASFVLIIYRIAYILLFRKNFMDEHLKLDKYYTLLIGGIFVFNILFFYSLPLFINYFEIYIEYDLSKNSKLLLLCLFQVTFWINTAIFEVILQRENLVKQFLSILIGFGSILVGGFMLMDLLNIITLESIIWFNTLIVFLLFYGQQMILIKKKVAYRKSLVVHSIQGILFIIITSLI